jgi:antitoxin ChpS
MRTQVRKIGNSSGTIIPAQLLKQMHLNEGDSLDVVIGEGCIVIRPVKEKPKYTLSELLAKCDPAAPIDSELEAWEQMAPAGDEV